MDREKSLCASLVAESGAGLFKSLGHHNLTLLHSDHVTTGLLCYSVCVCVCGRGDCSVGTAVVQSEDQSKEGNYSPRQSQFYHQSAQFTVVLWVS